MRTSLFATGLASFALAFTRIAHADPASPAPPPPPPSVSAPVAPAPPRQCAAIEGGSPALEALDAEERLTFIRRVMKDQGVRADRWRWGWSAVGVALAVGQYALLPLYPRDKWFEQAFAGTASLYLPLSLAVFPLKIQHYSDLIERAATDTEGADGQHMMPCLVLATAEGQLLEAARDEAQLTSALMQVATVVLGIGYGAIFALGFKDLAGTIENGVGALVIGEAQFFTTPRGAVRALRRYRNGDLSGAPLVPPRFFSISLGPSPAGAGVSLVATF